MTRITKKEWLNIMGHCVGLAVFVPVSTYLIFPDIMDKNNVWQFIFFGFGFLFIIELIGCLFDHRYGYKQKIANAEKRFFNWLFKRKK